MEFEKNSNGKWKRADIADNLVEVLISDFLYSRTHFGKKLQLNVFNKKWVISVFIGDSVLQPCALYRVCGWWVYLQINVLSRIKKLIPDVPDFLSN